MMTPMPAESINVRFEQSTNTEMGWSSAPASSSAFVASISPSMVTQHAVWTLIFVAPSMQGS